MPTRRALINRFFKRTPLTEPLKTFRDNVLTLIELVWVTAGGSIQRRKEQDGKMLQEAVKVKDGWSELIKRAGKELEKWGAQWEGVEQPDFARDYMDSLNKNIPE